MKYLIDTHVCLWAVAEKQKLSAHVEAILENPEIEILYSQVSLLEIAIKFQAGKLPDFEVTLEILNDTLQQKGFTILPLTNKHLSAYFNCNFFSEEHRDPFDRCLITKDAKFQLYKNKVNIVW